MTLHLRPSVRPSVRPGPFCCSHVPSDFRVIQQHKRGNFSSPIPALPAATPVLYTQNPTYCGRAPSSRKEANPSFPVTAGGAPGSGIDSTMKPNANANASVPQPAALFHVEFDSSNAGNGAQNPAPRSPSKRALTASAHFIVDGRGGANHRGRGSSQTFIFLPLLLLLCRIASSPVRGPGGVGWPSTRRPGARHETNRSRGTPPGARAAS